MTDINRTKAAVLQKTEVFVGGGEVCTVVMFKFALKSLLVPNKAYAARVLMKSPLYTSAKQPFPSCCTET